MKRSTREDWAGRVAKWDESGLSLKKFAGETGLNARSLSWWKWHLARKTAQTPAPSRAKRALARRPTAPIAKVPTTISPLTFVEMTSVIAAEPLKVVLPSSVRIRVRPGFDGTTLGRLLDVLETRR